MIGYGVKFGGRVSQAWRHCIENNLLSRPVHFHYSALMYASKSYVPKEVRDAVTPDVRRLEKIHRGPRHARLQGAYVTRDWSKAAAGDWYQADDVTLNTYYYAPDERGKITLMRGQVLLMIDVRSTCILSFAMLDQRNYTSHAIRTLITRTCDAFGLPRRGFYFERGIWQSSRLLKGDQSASDDEVSQSETEGGLRDLGLTDMERENHFAVELSPAIDAMDAPNEVLGRELARIDGHNRYARHRYRTVARSVGLNPRLTYMDSDSARLGGEIEAQQSDVLAERKDREKRAKKGRAVLGDLGFATRPNENYDDQRIAAAERVARELKQFSEENS